MSDAGEEELDPRIEQELERLNSSSSDINKFEKELESIQKAFVDLSRQAGSQLAAYQKKLGVAVERARPYYQLKTKLDKAQAELCVCTQDYEKLIVGFNAAEEMLRASEEKRESSPTSETCKIMVEISRSKVGTISEQLAASKVSHSEKYLKVANLNEQLQRLKRDNARHIAKSEPYFQVYEKMCRTLEDKKAQLGTITASLAQSKQTYSDALAALETISNEIHKVRSALGDAMPSAPTSGTDSEFDCRPEQRGCQTAPDTTPDISLNKASGIRPHHSVNSVGTTSVADTAECDRDHHCSSAPVSAAAQRLPKKTLRSRWTVSAIDPMALGRLQSLDLPVTVEYSEAEKRRVLMKTFSVDACQLMGPDAKDYSPKLGGCQDVSAALSPIASALRRYSLPTRKGLARGESDAAKHSLLSALARTSTDSASAKVVDEEASSVCSHQSGSVSSIDEAVSMLKATL
ncbi:SH3 domain-binding protein 5-like isoform X1 [Sycon ciliatum]|uniref:SH3 domain-binding protein 5-like isoform X1 n=1 Tax=Sycon ciliatum TaxID=27933 RepID=UPI0031F65E49